MLCVIKVVHGNSNARNSSGASRTIIVTEKSFKVDGLFSEIRVMMRHSIKKLVSKTVTN